LRDTPLQLMTVGNSIYQLFGALHRLCSDSRFLTVFKVHSYDGRAADLNESNVAEGQERVSKTRPHVKIKIDASALAVMYERGIHDYGQ
jgi:hypothetical protein